MTGGIISIPFNTAASMISYLKGSVLKKGAKSIILDVQNVGYLVNMPSSQLEKIEEQQELELFIHTNVREDDISLYGFCTQEQWEFFRLLLGVSGIGPRSALEIINVPLAHSKQAIAQRDSAFFIRLPGIGRKTAERLCIDLEGKIKELVLTGEYPAESHHDDVVTALMALGYKRHQVTEGLKKIPNQIKDEEEIIKLFLKGI